MMNLREKLKQFDSARTKSPKLNAAVVRPHPELKARETASGVVYTRTRRYPLSFPHGGINLGQFNDLHGSLLAYLANSPEFTVNSVQSLAFIDTETTGLAGGTGTYPFLVGVGKLSNDEFLVRQFLMADLQHENVLLESLKAELDGVEALISYNGKTYDAPLLMTRYILNRLDTDIGYLQHLDLLHCMRRLFRDQVDSCSLQSMERFLLGFRREDDVPGWEIPHLFFNFLREQDFAPLIPVCKHNVLDILSMVSMIVHGAHGFSDPLPHSKAPYPVHMFRIINNVAGPQQALDFIQTHVPNPDDNVLSAMAFTHKRLGQWRQAETIWLRLIEKSLGSDLPYIELAKIYEHQYKQYDKALDILDQFNKRRELNLELGRDIRTSDDLDHRRKRLRAKQNNENT